MLYFCSWNAKCIVLQVLVDCIWAKVCSDKKYDNVAGSTEESKKGLSEASSPGTTNQLDHGLFDNISIVRKRYTRKGLSHLSL